MAKKARRKKQRAQAKQEVERQVYTTEDKSPSLQSWLEERNQTPEGWKEPMDVTGYKPTPFESYPDEPEVAGTAKPDVWTDADVRAWLADAFKTIGMLPSGRIKPQTPGSGMLEAVQDVQDAYGYTDEKLRPVPSVEAVTRAEIVYPDWILAIPIIRQRKVVVMRATGLKYRQIGRRLRMSHEGARKNDRSGVRAILRKLNRVQKSS